jgi:hypothetical protein
MHLIPSLESLRQTELAAVVLLNMVIAGLVDFLSMTARKSATANGPWMVIVTRWRASSRS